MAQSSKPLHEAIWKNDENAFISCLEKGEDLNVKDEKGLKPLHIAVMTSNEKFVKQLLSHDKKKVEIDSKTWFYLTSISNEKIVDHLLHHHHGSLENPRDNNGYSALHHAVINRKTRLIGLFCVLGCDVNSRSNNGLTPLHLSAIANDLEIMDNLLYHGANTRLKTADGKTVLYFAVRHRHTQFIRLFIQKSDVDLNQIVDINSGSSALHIAVENNDERMIKLLIQNKANIMCKDRNGRNLLHVAVEFGHDKWIDFFIKKGIHVNKVANDNSTPLIIALQSKKKNIVSTLLDYGADVNIRNSYGLSPHCAALQQKSIELVQRLVLLRANVNNLTLENSSVLHFAVKYCDENMVNFLLRHGAKLGVKDCLGQNELHIAAKYNNSNMLQYLLNLGMDVNEVTLDRSTALHNAVRSNLSKSDDVAVLIRHGIVIDAENESGDTALNLVCRSECKDVYNIVERLLAADADVNHMGSDKKLPLHSCIESAMVSTAYLLAKHGAILNKVNLRGDSVLQLLIKHSCGCACTRGEYIKDFLKYGADLHNVNKDGETVLHTSLMYERFENVHEIKNLFNMGVQLSCNRSGESALHLAIKLSNTKSTTEEIVQFLLEKDAPLDDITLNGSNIIHYAAQYSNNVNIIKLVLDKIKPYKYYLVNGKDNQGKTPLHIASALGLNSFVEVLLEHNADINSKDNMNNSALHHAINGNHVETVKLLLKKGASTTDRNKDGSNAYDLAKQKDCHIYQLLLNY